MKEGILDGITGFVVSENDIDGFCDKLLLFFDQPILIHEFGTAGRRFVMNNYSNSNLTKKLVNLYSSI
jgi:glycosyltransferase involved in cell wall biosynthesis